jgi:hypothetical protein
MTSIKSMEAWLLGYDQALATTEPSVPALESMHA